MTAAVVIHVRGSLNVDLSEVLVKSRVGVFGAESEKVFEGRTHLEHVVLVAADGELFDGRAREGVEAVNDVFGWEERSEVDLAQWDLLGPLKGFSSEGSVEGELVKDRANIADNALCADAVEVGGLVIAAAEVDKLEGVLRIPASKTIR
jgi:hypothetical protein